MEIRNRVIGPHATHPSVSELFVVDSLSSKECPGDTQEQVAAEDPGTHRHADPFVWQSKTEIVKKYCSIEEGPNIG